MKKLLLSLLAIILTAVFAGCQLKTTSNTMNLPDISSVKNFSSYAELREYLKDFYEEKDGYYSLKGGLRFVTMEAALQDGLVGANANYTEDTGSPQQQGYSKTNTQVDGVDESDTVITDGEFIYIIANGKFFIIDVDTLDVLYTYEAENLDVYNMYFKGNRVVLLGNQYTPPPAVEEKNDLTDYYYYYWYSYGVKVVVLDIEDKEAVTVAKELYFDQSYLTESRMIDGQLYLIMNNYYVNYGYIEDAYVPVYRDSAASNELITLPAENIYFMPNDNYYISYLLIASVNVMDDSEAQVDAYIGSSYQIYMSLNNLYSIVYRSILNEETGYYDSLTYVLRFEIEEGKLVYKAMGSIEGSPLNQFSMDEYQGKFRIATTDWTWTEPSSTVNNQLFILDATSIDEMTFVSVLGGLGKPGERIYAVRYSGDTAYVVTFINTDPLYKIDLSNPLKPEIVGELYENGVSDYLHDINENLMLGVGRQADNDGRFQGVKISLYNTEGDDPVNLENYFIEGTYSYTPVTYDHKMFVYYEPNGADYMYVAIPVFEYGLISQYNYRYSQNLYVFKVTYEGDLSFEAKLPVYTEPLTYEDEYYYYDYLLRGLFIDNYVYSITYRTIKKYDMSTGYQQTDILYFGD